MRSAVDLKDKYRNLLKQHGPGGLEQLKSEI